MPLLLPDVRASSSLDWRLQGAAQPGLALAIPRLYRKSAVAESVRACLSGRFPDLFVSESQADCPSFLALAVLVDGWGELGLLQALRRLREISITALAISTDRHSSLAELLEAGASDAVHWPITPRELVARVGARLPRTTTAARPAHVRIDAALRVLVCQDLTVPLTSSQFALLSVLFQRPGEWVSSRGLMNTALRSKQDDTARLRVQIYRLREKLRHQSWRLQSDRDLGYRFDVSNGHEFVKNERTPHDDRKDEY